MSSATCQLKSFCLPASELLKSHQHALPHDGLFTYFHAEPTQRQSVAEHLAGERELFRCLTDLVAIEQRNNMATEHFKKKKKKKSEKTDGLK